MPRTYAYKVRDRSGSPVEGTLEADSPALVVAKLRELGYVPVSVEAKGGSGLRAELRLPGRGAKVRPKDLSTGTRQLATMVDAGLPLVRSLAVLGEQGTGALAAVLDQVRLDVERGSDLSGALARHPKAFDHLFVAMVKAGEAGGVLDRVLRQLAATIEKQVELRRKIKSAMAYPVAVLVLVLVILTAMLVFVVPQFQAIYAQLGGKLPKPTLILLAVSRIVSHDFPFVAAGGALGSWAFRRWRRTSRGRSQWDSLVLRVPLFGSLAHKSALARFGRTLSALLDAGVPMLEALEITRDAVGNMKLGDAVGDMQAGVKGGEALARRMGAHAIFPPMVAQMVSIGEETGAVGALLDKVALFYEQEVEAMVAALTSLLEPLLIVVLGAVVGSMVISLYLPLFDVIKLVQPGG